MNRAEIVQAAQRALLYEVSVNPKPGLVDPASTGSHQDMDVFTFIDSAISLQPYFSAAAALGANYQGYDYPELFEQLRQLGVEAEQTMFTVTQGINTHKGAIFSLGILVCASSYTLEHQQLTPTKIQALVQAMLKNLTAQDFSRLQQKDPATLTAGERQFLNYGVKGIRGEAEAGFPSVFEWALPFFNKTTGDLNGRLLDTLMMISSKVEDSNLIKRANSIEIIPWWRDQVEVYFKLGGSHQQAGLAFVKQLDDICIDKNLSLGGSADLLILTIFLALITENI